MVSSRIIKRVNMWRTLLCDGRPRAILRSAEVSGRGNPAAALRGVRAALQGTLFATVPPLDPLEHTLVVSRICSARVLPGHASYVCGIRHLFLKKARFSAPFLLKWTADCSHGEPMARYKPSRVHRAFAIPLHVCQLVLTENVVARLASCIEHAKRVGLRRAEQPRGKGFILRRQSARTHTLVFRQGALRFLVVQLSPLWQAEFHN